MKALIYNNKVVQLEKSEFTVSSGLTWMDAPKDCAVGWSLKDGVLIAPEPEPELTYAEKRRLEYPSIADQLDEIYHNGVDSWKAIIKQTKDKYPKG